SRLALLWGSVWNLDLIGRAARSRVGGQSRLGAFGLQPAGRQAPVRQRDERRLLLRTPVERVRAARVEAAAARRPPRVGNLSGQSLGKEAAAVRVRDRADQRLAV